MHPVGSGSGPVVVTGAAGYLGSHVLRRLAEVGVNAIGFDACPGPGLLRCDMTRADAVDQIKGLRPPTVIHLAAIVPRNQADYDDERAASANLAMTASLIDAAPPHVVFASSMTVYSGWHSMAVREDDAPAPGHGYAGCKRRSELMLLTATNIQVTILRLAGLFGAPRRGGLLFNVAAALASGQEPALPYCPPIWAPLHVEDAAELIVRAALRTGSENGILNAGYPGKFSTSMAVNALARLFGRPPLTDVPAPEFEMDLSRAYRMLGELPHSFSERLAQLVEEVKIQVGHRHAS